MAISLGRAVRGLGPHGADLTADHGAVRHVRQHERQARRRQRAVGARRHCRRRRMGSALMRVLVFLAGILVIVLAFVGIGQRLREYR